MNHLLTYKLKRQDGIKTLGILTLATIFSFFMATSTQFYNNEGIPYLFAVVLISFITQGYFWGIISAVVSSILVYGFFAPSHIDGRFHFSLIAFIELLVVSFITSLITSYNKIKATQTSELLEQASLLNEINNTLLSANSLSYIAELAVNHIHKMTHSTVIFYFHSPQRGDTGIIKYADKNHEITLHSYHEEFLANWAFENKQMSGVGTNFCGTSTCTYFPLISHNKVWGVIGLYRKNRTPPKESVRTFISLMSAQVAMALERQFLTDTRHNMIIETEKEKMRANLLRAVSHDLRTPLTGIIGNSEMLTSMPDTATKEEQRVLLNHIYEDANWLLNMVENLLSVTRIGENNSVIKKVPEPLEEVVSEAIHRTRKRIPDIQIKVTIPDEFLLIPMDATLIEQVIINLIENAYKHSGTQTPIEFTVTKEESFVFFQVVDYGKGLEMGRVDFIFDGYTLTPSEASDSVKGFGIGLSICKTIILAHGGTITARNGLDKGAIFTFCLPLQS